jgi:type IV secretion system protein VirB4
MNKWFSSAGSASDLISIQRMVDERIFSTEEGGYGASFRLRGVDPECLNAQDLEAISAQVLQVQRQLPEDFSLYQIVLKHRGFDLQPSSRAGQGNVVGETQRARHSFLTGCAMTSIELYWTIYANPPKSRKRVKPEAFSKANATLLRRLRSSLSILRSNLDSVVALQQLDGDGIAGLYSYIANLDPLLMRKRLTSKHNIATQLTGSSLTWKEDSLQIGQRHAMLFSLLRRPSSTRPNLFGDLLRLDADLVLVLESRRRSPVQTRKAVTDHQTFVDLFRHSLLTLVAHRGKSGDILKSAQTVAADKGVDNLGGIIDDIDNAGLNYCQFSLIGMLHSRNKAELEDQMAQVHRVFGRSEASALEEGLGTLSAFCALGPGATRFGQRFNVRTWWLREDHLANLSPIYAPHLGEAKSEMLEDEALATFETRDGTPFYFDPYHNGRRGMLVFGSPGRGKSFLLNFLVDNETKYGGFIYIFDIGGSYESTILKHDGKIVRFGLEGPRLNPFSLDNTKPNREFVFRLVRLLLVKGGAKLTPQQESDVKERVDGMFELSPAVRRLRHLLLPPELQPYLDKWVGDGMYGQVFDNLHDELTLSRRVAFEFEDIDSEQSDLMEPLLFWIKWRIAAVTHSAANLSVPKVEIYDEVWKHMQDPQMLAMILNSSKTARKHLGGIVLATHLADDLGTHTQLIRNACADTVFLGGAFDRAQYAELFSLSAKPLDLIASLQRGESLLARSGYAKVLRLNVDAESAWHYTTRPLDRARRAKAVQEFGREHAFRELVAAESA